MENWLKRLVAAKPVNHIPTWQVCSPDYSTLTKVVCFYEVRDCVKNARMLLGNKNYRYCTDFAKLCNVKDHLPARCMKLHWGAKHVRRKHSNIEGLHTGCTYCLSSSPVLEAAIVYTASWSLDYCLSLTIKYTVLLRSHLSPRFNP